MTPSLVTLAILAVTGSIVRKEGRTLRLGLLLWLILSLSTTFGVPVVGHLLELVPGVSHTAFFRWAPTSWEFAVVILAAMGIDDAARRKATPGVIWLVAGVALLAWVVSAALAIGLIDDLRAAAHIHLYLLGSLGWAVGMTVAITATMLWTRSIERPLRGGGHRLLAALVLVDTIAMFLVPQFSAPPKASVDMAPAHFLQSHLYLERFFTLGPIQPDYGSYFQIAETNSSDIPIPRLWAEYVKTHLAPNTNPAVFSGLQVNSLAGPSPWQQFVDHFHNYEEIGVKFLVVPYGEALGSTTVHLGMRRVFHDHVATIYELPHPEPPSINSKRAAAEWITHPRALPQSPVHRQPSSSGGELYFPGWTATVNGHAVAISRVRSLFQSVTVPAGRSTVRFAYQPPYILPSLLGALLGLVLLGGELGGAGWRSWTKDRTDHESGRQ